MSTPAFPFPSRRDALTKKKGVRSLFRESPVFELFYGKSKKRLLTPFSWFISRFRGGMRTRTREDRPAQLRRKQN
jgi:hypothetical protein